MTKNSCPSKEKDDKTKYLFHKPYKSRDDFLAEIVGQFIARRQHLQLTQEEVDSIMGNGDRQCSKWECGQRTPTSFNLQFWAEALDSKIALIPNLEQ